MNGFDEPVVAPLSRLDRALFVAAIAVGTLSLSSFLWLAGMLIKAGG